MMGKEQAINENLQNVGKPQKKLAGKNRGRVDERPTEDDFAKKWTDQSSGHNSNT